MLAPRRALAAELGGHPKSCRGGSPVEESPHKSKRQRMSKPKGERSLERPPRSWRLTILTLQDSRYGPVEVYWR